MGSSRSWVRVGGVILLCGAGLVLGLPAGAGAAPPPPSILGSFDVERIGQVNVRAVGSQYSGTVDVPNDPGCLDPGREIWHINEQLTFPPNAEIYQGEVEYRDLFGCGSSVGFGRARWDFRIPANGGILCSFPPGLPSGPQECHLFDRVGAAPAGLDPFVISRVVRACMSRPSFYRKRSYLCNQLYYASGAGRVRTQVYYCMNAGFVPCPKDLSKCAVPPGYPPPQFCTENSPGRLSQQRQGRKRIVTVASGSADFPAAGYGGLDLTLSSKGRKQLRKLAKDHKKLALVVSSYFDPEDGSAGVATGERFVLKTK